MKLPLLLDGMSGLGDNLYQRAVLHELCKRRVVYLTTPFPQLYADMPVLCVQPPPTRLRTQGKNLARPWRWHQPPDLCDRWQWHYSRHPQGTMLEALCQQLGVVSNFLTFDGPPVVRPTRAPYVVVRPVTRRTEWSSESREPRAMYLAQAVEALRPHFTIVSVADIDPPHEVAVEPMPRADQRYHAGELNTEELLGLVAGAAGVVGGVGWIAPAAVAYRVPALLVFGGRGAHNSPQRIFDPRMDTSRIVQALPDNLCPCSRADHACDKTITHMRAFTDTFLWCLNVPDLAA